MGQLKPVKVTFILPPEGIVDAVVQEKVTVTQLDEAMSFDSDTEAFGIVPKMETREPVLVESKIVFTIFIVLIVTFDKAP